VSFNKALENNLNNGDLWRKVGDVQCKLEKYSEAIVSYNMAIKLQIDDLDSLKTNVDQLQKMRENHDQSKSKH
jgi:tetratricopeptide (TPR) repeat protein